MALVYKMGGFDVTFKAYRRSLMRMKYMVTLLFLVLVSVECYANDSEADIQALTTKGDKVILHANGRWEFIDAQKAMEAKAIADEYPDNKGCPPGWQGGYLGIGRCIPPGDKDFRRGSMGGK